MEELKIEEMLNTLDNIHITSIESTVMSMEDYDNYLEKLEEQDENSLYIESNDC